MSPHRRPTPGPRIWSNGFYYFDEVIGFAPNARRIRHSLGTQDPKLARRLWEKERARQWSLYYGEDAKAPIAPARFSDLIPEFIAFKRDVRRAKTWQTYEQRLDHVAAAWQNPLLPDIGAADVRRLEEYLATLPRKRTKATINHYVAFLREFFAWAIDQGHFVGPNPMRAVKPYPVARVRRAYTAAEMRLIAEAAERISSSARNQDEIMRIALPLVLLLYYTGMRLAEALNLRWESVCDGVIRFEATATKQAREKTIPITSPVAVILRALEAERRDDYVFPLRRRSGGVYQSGWTNGLLRRIRQESGVQDFLFHGLRHTASTLMATTIGHGATLRDVMAVLGHSKTETTLRYQHEARDRMAAALASIPEIGYTAPVEIAENEAGGREDKAKSTGRKKQLVDNKRD